MVNIDLSTVVRDGHAVVGLRGELDVNDAAGVTVALAGVVAGHPDIIIDLTGLADVFPVHASLEQAELVCARHRPA
jgi:anti-anti-sigma regulatory factor